MSKYHFIPCNIWDDVKFADYEPEKQLILIYLTSNYDCEISGIYEVSPKKISQFTSVAQDKVVDILKSFEPDVVEYDFEDGVVFVKNFFKYNSAKGGNPTSIYKKIQSSLELSKSPRFVSQFLNLYKVELEILQGDTFLYIVSLKSSRENFVKIGVSYDCDKRFKKLNSYKYAVKALFLKKYNKREDAIHDEELLLSSSLKNYKYVPIRKFDGSDECFKKEVLTDDYLINWLTSNSKDANNIFSKTTNKGGKNE